MCVFLVQTYPGGRDMDEFVYACPDHGAVAVITRREIAVSQPPAACPWCRGPLRKMNLHIARACSARPEPLPGGRHQSGAATRREQDRAEFAGRIAAGATKNGRRLIESFLSLRSKGP